VDILDFPGAAAWESWLAAHHGVRAEAWLRIAKRHSGIANITIADALDVALCYGWIDGQRKAHDEVSFLQRYSRRRPNSSWSKVNVAKAEALIAGRRRTSRSAPRRFRRISRPPWPATPMRTSLSSDWAGRIGTR
jgi:uncharacterized protein YdeI (YjbR/CyaY-like superfamily)